MARTLPPSRDMSCALQLGNIAVSWVAEGVSWSPDVADDMTNRCLVMLEEALQQAAAFGLLETDSEVIADDGTLAGQGADEDGE